MPAGIDLLTPRFLEGMNGTLANLLIFGAVMFSIYIGIEVKDNGFSRQRLQAGISILVLLVGDAMIRGYIWLYRYLENRGHDITWMKDHWFLPAGILVEIVGIICVIRVFAPDRWGSKLWLVSSLLAIALATVFSYL